MTKFYKCTKCDIIYILQDSNPELVLCPLCGLRLDLSISVEDNVSIHALIRKVDKLAGYKGSISEQIAGDEINHKTGKWSIKNRIIDWGKKWYYEIVIDKETGEIIHFCSEPLDQHLGHGSDRKNL